MKRSVMRGDRAKTKRTRISLRSIRATKSATSREPEKPRRVVDQHTVARHTVRNVALEETDPLRLMLDAVVRDRGLVRADEAVDVRPVGAPHAALRRRLVE